MKDGFDSVTEIKGLPAKVREGTARDLWLELQMSDDEDVRNTFILKYSVKLYDAIRRADPDTYDNMTLAERDALKSELTKDVILVSMMMVNNETGALYDTAAVAKMMKASSPEALLHIDATQSYLKVPFTKLKSGADMITISSHNIEGPKGVGALVVDSAVMKSRGLTPITLGGGQEGGMRSGTENVPGIAAFGEAVRIGYANMRDRYYALSELRNYLIERIEGELTEISITKPPVTAPHILNITLPKIKSETMLHYLSSLGIYVSSGSACSSNSSHISSALTAFGKSDAEADSSIRISLSYRNTKEDIDSLIAGLKSGLEKLSRIR